MRNEFHEYQDYEYAKAKTDEIFEQMKDKSVVIPYFKNLNCNELEYVYRRGDCNMNYALDKGDFSGNPFPTVEYTGEYETYIKRERAVIKKDNRIIQRKSFNPVFDNERSEWVYTCYSPLFKPITDDIQTLYELCREYRQISAGKNHWERQNVAADFDIDFTEDTINNLNLICKDNGIPHYTYLERHLDSNHYQIGWILDKPLVVKNKYGCFTTEHSLYLKLIKKIAILFGSDPNYKGWWLKNPNCVRLTETQWFNDTVNKEEFIKAFESMDIISSKDSKKHAKKQNKQKAITEDSRNDFLMEQLRKWIWSYMNKNGKKPPYKEVVLEGKRIANEAGVLTQKGKQETQEILSVIESVYRWSIAKYRGYKCMEVPLNVWVLKAKKEIKVINAYEVFLEYLNGTMPVTMKGNIKTSVIVKDIARINYEDERSARSQLKWVMDTAHIGGVSSENIGRLFDYLLCTGKKGPKVSEYVSMCEEALRKYRRVMSDYIETQIYEDC